ncbi:hypothetical protein PtB15_3B165 [Puccinia triticina]|nr:hypothetical protein PtB15_3B165 [Puccinia triticina]
MSPRHLPASTSTLRVDIRGAEIVDEAEGTETSDIYLPKHTEFISHIALDPNGILIPTVVRDELYASSRPTSSDPQPPADPPSSSLDDPLRNTNTATHDRLSSSASISAIPGGRLNFIKFETGAIESECITFIDNLIQLSAESNRVPIATMKRAVKIILTGGGAYMYADLIKNALGGDVEVLSEDEMDCLITGLNFITEIPNEVFWFSDQLVQEIIHNTPADPANDNLLTKPASTHEQPDQAIEQFPRPSPNPPQYSLLFDSNPTPQFPCMLVNIGSGVSIIKVTHFGKFERISGTSLGGGTLWGLLSLLTEAKSFDEMLDLSLKGDNSKVDMLVGDIYGQDYGKIGLKSSTIASSFGKGQPPSKAEFRPEDISKSLLYAISNNIGQIAHLNAEKHGLDRIYFGGCFIRGHAATVSTLSYAIRFWSKGSKRAFFLRHEGYLGSIGAWLKNIGHEIDAASNPPSPIPKPA